VRTVSPLRTVNGLLDRLDQAYVRARRMTAVPAVLRLVAAVAAFMTVLVALPAALTFGRLLVYLVPVALLLAAGVGLFPGSRWVSFVELVGVGAWVVAGVAFGDPASLLRIGALGALLYLTHTAAAFAAVIPVECVVAPGVLRRWARRQALVLAGGLAIGLGGLTLAQLIPATPSLVGVLVGSLVAATLGWVLARLARTPR
jgi:hypothetical protein